MIERILEPEIMDSHEEALDYDTMNHSEVNRTFVDDLCTAIPTLLTGTEEEDEFFDVLDLGTGTALIPIELCERAADEVRVMAADASIPMLELANMRIEVASLTHRIQLCQSDAKEVEFEPGMFHLVMSNSIVHHIPEPVAALQNAMTITKAEGHLFFRDLMRPESKEQLDQLVAKHAGEATESQQKLFAESLHAALTVSEMQDLVEQLGFDRSTVSASSDRHWTWFAQKPA